MTTYLHSWEQTLLSWAKAPLLEADIRLPLQSVDSLLDKAYDHCKHITKHYSRTFYLASRFLPKPKRRAVHALYAVSRITDDIVDQADSTEDPKTNLEEWFDRLSKRKSNHHHPVILAWADASARYKIPTSYLRQLIDGVALDLRRNRYHSFDELAEYSYGVASTVGLMSMHITGFSDLEAVPYALKLGIALQMTNILRDVGEDWQRGRVYLPQQELADFNITENDLSEGTISNDWREFMRFQIARNRKLYAESLAGIRYLNADGRFAVTAAAELYQAILSDIEAHDYNVFTRRSYVRKSKMLPRLAQIWWRNISRK